MTEGTKEIKTIKSPVQSQARTEREKNQKISKKNHEEWRNLKHHRTEQWSAQEASFFYLTVESVEK